MLWLVLMTALVLSLNAHSSSLANESWFELSATVVTMGLLLNLIPDYLSLIETPLDVAENGRDHRAQTVGLAVAGSARLGWMKVCQMT